MMDLNIPFNVAQKLIIEVFRKCIATSLNSTILSLLKGIQKVYFTSDEDCHTTMCQFLRNSVDPCENKESETQRP